MATDVISLITADHSEVDELLDRISSGDPNAAELLEKLVSMLKAHSEAESEVVYPAIKKAVPDVVHEVHDGEAEHEQIEQMLDQIGAMEPGEPGFDGLLAAVAAAVRHHVEEEENDVLPAFRDAVSSDELEDLGRRFTERKEAHLRNS